jgi:hypothetical protein
VLFVFWVNVPFWIGWAVRRFILPRPQAEFVPVETLLDSPEGAGILHGK